MAAKRFNAVTLEMLWTRLISIVDEAAAALVRTSFSTVVRESNDFACVLTDARGQSLAQATDSIPSFIGTVPRTIRHFLEAYPPEALAPEDILITNDIWMGTGHLPDITVAKPIFQGRRLVGFAGSVAHSPDIGGRIRSPDARDVFEEGLQIPVMKAVRGGQDRAGARAVPAQEHARSRPGHGRPVRAIHRAHPDGAAREGAARRAEAEIARRSRRARSTRAPRPRCAPRSARCPTASTGRRAVSDGLAEPIRLEMTLTVKDDSIAIDYAGSAPQVLRAINVCMAYTIAYTSFGVKAVLAPGDPEQRRRAAPGHDHGARGLDLQLDAAGCRRRARADRTLLPDDGDPGALEGAARARRGDGGLAAVVPQHRRPPARRVARSPACSSSTAATAPRPGATARTCCRGRATSRRRRWR